ncbi:MAG TPA: S1/P1 nuclease [Blastocatellia bacterium]|nr:S1/P1 nuclease [Blastocatellia bacterium]
MKKLTTTLLIVGLLAGSVYGYGPVGHQLVGAIADKRLATNPTINAKVNALLDGLTLERAATLADEIKTDNPDGFRMPGNPTIEAQLRAFVAANTSPSHRDFHFTDVPVFGDEKYADGAVGREPFDIVHMIPFCIRVLKGEESDTNDRAITKTVAVILIAHYLGDIHQPLHVGAEYFNSQRKPFEPTETDPGFSDQGGNKLTLFLLINAKGVSAGNLHGYWDTKSVTTAIGNSSFAQLVQKLANSRPPGLRLKGGTETWAEQMADEIMPVAREAHTRLTFTQIKTKPGAKFIVSGRATEKKTSGLSYKSFAGVTVNNEIQKAGWRLALVLEDALK